MSKANTAAIAQTVNSLRAEIEALKKAQVQAQKAVANAREAIKKTDGDNKKGTEKPKYGESDYWEERYAAKDDKTAPKSTSSDEGLYEWYINFDEFQELFVPDLATHSLPAKSSIMVAGNGNSSFCEDLYKNGNTISPLSQFVISCHIIYPGYTNTVGVDVSAAVTQQMKSRSVQLGMKGLQYLQADLTAISCKPACYDIIVDKGTLDAIASSGGGAVEAMNPQSAPAYALYMREMWRLLRIGGLFVVITTMPPSIFQAIAIEVFRLSFRLHAGPITPLTPNP